MKHGATLQSLTSEWTKRGDHPAVIVPAESGGEVWTYGRLANNAQRLAGGLIVAGLGRAEPVALLAPASPRWLVCCFGIIAAGGIAVPLDPQLPPEMLVRLMRDSGCRRLFTTSLYSKRLREVPECRSLETILLTDETGEETRSWRKLLAVESTSLPACDPDEPALLFYTSGTTGEPKGVPLSHVNLLSNVKALEAANVVDETDRVLLPLPLHHTYPFTVGVLGTLLCGSALILPRSLSETTFSLALSQATVLLGVPRLYTTLVDSMTARLGPLGRRLLRLCIWSRRQLRLPLGRWMLLPVRRAIAPRLRLAVCGGAALDEKVEWTLKAIGWSVLTGYGLTETSPMLTFNLPGRSRVGSAGRPLPGITLRIDRTTSERIGEIQVKGPNVFRGYWRKPDLSRRVFTADGWFRTEDLGHMDEDGYLFVTGRARDVIVLSSGEKVAPEEIEAVYEQGAYIQEAAIVEQGEVLVALVVPDDAAIRVRGAAQIENLVREDLETLDRQLKPSQRATRFHISREPLPRNRLGKLQRYKLGQRLEHLAERRSRRHPSELSQDDRILLTDPLVGEVWQWLKMRWPDERLSLDDSPQLDLGIDSLAWLGLTMEIEDRFGRHLSEEAVGRVVTLRDILTEVQRAPEATKAERGVSPTEPRGLALRTLAVVLYLLNWLMMRLMFRLRVEGLERLPAAGPCLLVPNHASYLDPLALAAALPLRRLWDIHWAGWGALLFATPLRRMMCRASQVFPVNPEHGGLSGLNTARELLERGQTVVWFAEGRLSRDGRLQSFSPGIGLLVSQTRACAVPVRIHGSFHALPRWRRLPRPRRIRVIFGVRLTWGALAPLDDGPEIHHQVASRLHDAVAALE